MGREVAVKGSHGLMEVGVGSVLATLVWESEPGEDGAFGHLARDASGRVWFSITDMEEHGGSYVSVPVTEADLLRLVSAVLLDEVARRLEGGPSWVAPTG